MITNFSDKKLTKKWGPVLAKGSPIQGALIKTTLSRVLENTARHLKRKGLLIRENTAFPSLGNVNHSVGSPATTVATPTNQGNYLNGHPATLATIVLPVLRRSFPELIAHELVGVQAMNGPIGFVLALRARLNNNGWVGSGTGETTAEIGFDPIDASYTGSPRLSTSWLNNSDQPYDSQSLNATGDTAVFQGAIVDGLGSGSDDVTGDELAGVLGFEGASAVRGPGGIDPANRRLGVGAENTLEVQYANLFNGTYPTVNFGFERKEVVARTRKLGAHWSPELAEDMEVMQSINVETELINILTFEIGAEIDRQILTELIKLAVVGGGVESIDAHDYSGFDQHARVIALLSKVNAVANQIAIDTRRAAGNFVIASPKICSILSVLGMNKYVSNGTGMPSVPASAVGALQKVGLINDGQQLLLRDTYAKVDYFLVGYKGTHPADAGLIYCPYIPIELAKVPSRVDTFTMEIGARTRYGMVSNPLEGSQYYKLVVVRNADDFLKGANLTVTTTP